MSVRVSKDLLWLNYHHLYYFYVIAKEGGIAKAAIKLNLGQPTLSTQLKQLEASIGHPLFERKNKRLILTEAGTTALSYAEDIFKLGSEMIEAIHDRLGPSRIHLQIGALDSVPKAIIEKIILYAYKMGNCSVSILEGKSDELQRELAAHRIDLMISNYPPDGAQNLGLYIKQIAKLKVSVFSSKKYLSARNQFPKSLGGLPTVLPTVHSKLRYDLEHYYTTLGIKPDVIAETQDTSIQRILGTKDVGVIPLAELAVTDLVKSKQLFKLGELDNVFEYIWIISAKRRVENPVASKVFKDFIIN